MAELKAIDVWGRLEVEWKEALDAAASRQREYDAKMTNHLVYHFAAPQLQELDEIGGLWQTVAEKRRAADQFIREYSANSA